VKQSITSIKTPVDENHLLLKINRKKKKKDKENPVTIHGTNVLPGFNLKFCMITGTKCRPSI